MLQEEVERMAGGNMRAQSSKRSEKLKGIVTVNAVQESCVCQLAIIEVRILFSRQYWGTEVLSFLMITFQGNGFQVFKKDTLELQEIQVYPKGTEEGFTVVKPFYLVNALRKGSRAYCQVLARTNYKIFWQPCQTGPEGWLGSSQGYGIKLLETELLSLLMCRGGVWTKSLLLRVSSFYRPVLRPSQKEGSEGPVRVWSRS